MVHLISVRPNRTHTRHVDLRAVNLNHPVGILFVFAVYRRLSSLCLCCLSVFSSLCFLAAVKLFVRLRVSLSLSLSLFLVSGWLPPCQSPSVRLWVRLALREMFVFLVFFHYSYSTLSFFLSLSLLFALCPR